jgi:hypothetical protein
VPYYKNKMFISALASLIGTGSVYWFVKQYKNEQRPYTNKELSNMSERYGKEQQEFLRKRKVVLTAAEIMRIDPTFKMPYVATTGEPDI